MPLETIEVPAIGEVGNALDALLREFAPVVHMARMLAAYYHVLRMEGVPEGVATEIVASLQDALFLQGFASDESSKGEDKECSE